MLPPAAKPIYPDGDMPMRTPLSTRVSGLALTLLVAVTPLLLPVLAMAQDDGAPPEPTLRRTAPLWLGYLVMFLLVAVVVVVSLIPSKRSHQD